MGFVELLALLMTLAGFGVDENTNAPSANEVLSHAPHRADYMVHVDLVGIVPNNYKILTELPNHSSLKNERAARAAVKELVAQAEMVRGMVQGAVGLDPVTDITSVTIWLNVPDAGDPNMLMVVRGNIPNDLIEKIGNASGMPVKKVHKRPTMSPDPKVLIGVGPGGELLVGSPSWVKPRLKKGWKRKGTSALVKGAAPLLDNKPAVLLASAPTKRWIRRAKRELANEPEAALALDLAIGHKFLGISFKHDGLEWTAVSRTKSGHARAVRASEGALDMMRAFHHGTRGMARLLLAGVPSYAGLDEAAKAIADNADQLIDLVVATTGDGNFKVNFKNDAKKRTVHVSASGKELSDVLPAAGMLPFLGAAGAFLVLGGADAGPQATMPASVAKPAKPVKRKGFKKKKR